MRQTVLNFEAEATLTSRNKRWDDRASLARRIMITVIPPSRPEQFCCCRSAIPEALEHHQRGTRAMIDGLSLRYTVDRPTGRMSTAHLNFAATQHDCEGKSVAAALLATDGRQSSHDEAAA